MPKIRTTATRGLDVVGVLFASAGLFGVVFGLTEGQKYNWSSFWPFVTTPEVIGAKLPLLVAFAVWQRYHSQALIPTVLFGNRNYALMAAAGAVVSFGTLGFFLPIRSIYSRCSG